jgi:hypothetical protein
MQMYQSLLSPPVLLGKNRSLDIVLLSMGVSNPGDTKHYFKIYG